MTELFTTALKVFSQERQTYFKNKRFKLAQSIEEEKAKKWPHYAKAEVMRLEKELKNFDESFAMEFKSTLGKLLEKVSQ